MRVEKINEAFREGRAAFVLEKLCKVLSRRLKREVIPSTISIAYVNKYGKFNGFLVGINNSPKLIRINFLLNESEFIYSVDFYENMKQLSKGYPSFTVDLMDDEPLNIVQIVDVIVENLINFDTDIDSIDESRINERSSNDSRYEQLFKVWMSTNPNAITDLTTKRIATVYTEYLGIDPQNNSEMNLANFTKLAKAFLFSKGLTNPTFRKKKKASREREIEDQAKADELADIVDSFTWEDKFTFLAESVEAVIRGDIQAVIVFGSPGSGKSKTVYDTLENNNAAYLSLKGGIKSADDLFTILSRHNKDEIIVMDDFDSVMKDINCRNMLKSALENTEERFVTWKTKQVKFTSAIIFISNLARFDTAILSRALNIKIDLKNEEMLDRIEKTMAGFHPEVSMDDKRKALVFLKELSRGVRSIDYREFEKVLICMKIQPKKWEKYAILMLQSQE